MISVRDHAFPSPSATCPRGKSKMQPTTLGNGVPNTAIDRLHALHAMLEQLQAEMQRKDEEIKKLKAERDEFRAVILEHLKKEFDPSAWENFTPEEYTLTLDDMLAVL